MFTAEEQIVAKVALESEPLTERWTAEETEVLWHIHNNSEPFPENLEYRAEALLEYMDVLVEDLDPEFWDKVDALLEVSYAY